MLALTHLNVASFAIGPAEDYGRLLLVPMTLVRPDYLAETLAAPRRPSSARSRAEARADGIHPERV